ncbi:GNAT family N-acetyltransferase [Streptacidiphilus fuscans]|uniref:GNAT family N-acetyltransferase n=1 Tax=Streptacidiphilus fuscans TaxID=2789292 RepID=A0A931B3Y8_9ACTN|nr:GNAT family protein [Streptacidiphilus fuscans]MBF9069806.1 GNAT family N-acetyltransferase [Streptacidiphilus fuscans]
MSDPGTSDEAPVDFSHKPVLTGSRVVLRPFRLDEDAEVIRDFLTDPEVVRFTDGRPVTERRAWTEESEQGMRAWYGTRNEQADRLDLAVVDRDTGRCVGEVVLNEWDPDNQSCNFRILLGSSGRDRGLGTEATRLIVSHGFERLRLHRISLSVFDHNPRARRAYAKVGFVLEGTSRQALRLGDTWVDDHHMAVLAHEWRRHRGHPETAAAASVEGAAGTA